MSEIKKNALSKIVVSTVGVGILYIVLKNRSKITQQVRYLLDYKNPLRNQHIEIAENAEDCINVVRKLKSHCNEYKVLGFDCEWVTVGGSRRPIALLQLSSHRGLCALIRLCRLAGIPKDLRDLLEDEDILKVGVAPHDDAGRLSHDYGVGVASTFDLRFLSARCGRKAEGLARLSKSILDVELDKDWRIRCSDWEAKLLTERQVQYAAKDAHVAIEIFKNLLTEINYRRRKFWQIRKLSWTEILNICEPFLDVKYKDSMFSNIEKQKGVPLNVENQNHYGFTKKSFKRFLCTRTKHLYDNCLLQAPDGELLCTCDKKKAEWYIHQNLGSVVAENPFTVRLNFEPAGRAVGAVGKYYTIAKINQCVVCGREDAYIRKNVVPREYRKHFPVVMKSHTSHDVLLLCPPCHQISNIADLKIREKLAKMCSAPYLNSEGGAKYVEIPKLRKLRSAARALLYSYDKLPEEKKISLQEVIFDQYPSSKEITKEILEEAANVDILEKAENYCSHGLKVVTEFTEKFGGLVELEKMWRTHFVQTMQPKYLPELWSVNHNANRLEIRANEGRVKKEDLKIAGLGLSTTVTESS